MWRTGAMVCLAACVLGLAGLTIHSVRLNVSLETRLSQMAQKLDELSRHERDAAPRPDSAVMEVTGCAYLGDREQPASGAELRICRLSETADQGTLVVRKLSTDGQGCFRSGPLPPGDYYVLGRLISPPDTKPFQELYVQSEPVYLYPGASPPPSVELDLRMEYGELALESSASIPLVIEAADSQGAEQDPAAVRPQGWRGDELTLLLQVAMLPRELADLPWLPTRPVPTTSPIRGALREVDRTWVESPENVSTSYLLAVGTYRLGAQAVPRPLPLERNFPRRQIGNETTKERNSKHLQRAASAFDPKSVSAIPSEFFLDIEVRAGETARVRIEIPVDYESRLREMITSNRIWWASEGSFFSEGREKPELSKPHPLKLTLVEPASQK